MHALPQPLPAPPAVPLPQDVPYPGVISLHVDVRDVDRGIFHVRERIPVRSGPMILLYPEWLPGFHSPAAAIELFAGLVVTANDHEIAWRRDPVDMYAFHLLIPQDVDVITVSFQYLSPTHKKQGRVTGTPNLLEVQWNTVVLHPAGYFARNINIDPVLRLPEGWSFACALASEPDSENRLVFERTALDVLVDSPLLAGRYFKRVALDSTIHLNLAADQPSSLKLSEEQIGQHRQLVQQADRLFRARHFDRYEFLVTLSDLVGDIGVEHHRSCEISSDPALFTSWDKMLTRRGSMAHEYVHSWNGKFLRGADSWAPCFHKPIRNSLMWVYEGLTQYLGVVLSARSGIWTADNVKDSLAATAARLITRKGRRWRPMSDTTRDPIISARGPLPWASWQRSEDYYQDGMFIWLDVDTIIREKTGGAKSLDDFVAAFFGNEDGDWATRTYEFGDVTDCLRQTVTYAWEEYFQHHLHCKDEHPPLNGLERSGYRLVYKAERNEFARSGDELAGALDLTNAIGISVSKSGEVSEVIWESAAFDAGITAGSRCKAVNGRPFTLDALQEEVTATSSGKPLVLFVEARGALVERFVAYSQGARFPHLESRPGQKAWLDEILREI